MVQPGRSAATGGNGAVSATPAAPPVQFDKLDAFQNAVESASGRYFDFESVTRLTINFVESTPDYLVLNVKGDDESNGNNLIFSDARTTLIYSSKPPAADAYTHFAEVLTRPFGLTTVLVFLTLGQVLATYRRRLESLITSSRELDFEKGHEKYRELLAGYERLDDRLEEFRDLLLTLEERSVSQVVTEYISFDYSVLMAETESLRGRLVRRREALREQVRDHQLQASEQLNRRIEGLSVVVRKLTAITIILMLPTIVASHFGMNFVWMPELANRWAYPAVIAGQLGLIGVGIYIMRKVKWL